jgi:hypothetical protein
MIVQDLIDEWQGLANARAPWEKYWRNIAAYVLPQTENFDSMLYGNADAAINSVVGTPVAAERSKNIYDMTSLWGVERLSAGLLSLKTPETEHWHGLSLDSYFGEEQSYEEDEAMERLRNYLFRVRSNPHTGFWDAHKAAVRSMCAFGDGWMHVQEQAKGTKAPFLYEYAPLPELYPGVGPDGQPDRMYRVYNWSARQIATKWGEKAGRKVIDMANDKVRMHERVRVMHAIRPRSDEAKIGKMGTQASKAASFYLLPEDKHLIGEGGYFEFPYVRYAWNNSGRRAFSEGPVALALGEIKSLQEMAKNELIGIQSVVRPAYAVHGRNMTRLNLNPGVSNPGLISPDGKPLFQPMNSGVRPDFAQSVLEARRNSVREMLYLNLWQIIIQDKQNTATEALIRAQEKGEMLGPVGISLNSGLANLIDREVAILARKQAFSPESPLAMPESAQGRDVAPIFSSPLDRLRRMNELVGMQRLVEFSMLLAGGDPQQAAKIMSRFDVDEMIEQAREILGAPVKSLVDKDAAAEARAPGDQMQQTMAALETMRAGGEAARAAGEGSAALAQGTEAAAASPAIQQALQLAGTPGAVGAGAAQASNAVAA